MSDLVGQQGAAWAGMLGPAVYAGLEESAVDDELTAAGEQVEQARLALGSVERVLLFHGQPGHSPTRCGQRVTGAGQLLLFHEQLLARSLPLLRGHDRGCVHCEFHLSVLFTHIDTGRAANCALISTQFDARRCSVVLKLNNH